MVAATPVVVVAQVELLQAIAGWLHSSWGMHIDMIWPCAKVVPPCLAVGTDSRCIGKPTETALMRTTDCCFGPFCICSMTCSAARQAKQVRLMRISLDVRKKK